MDPQKEKVIANIIENNRRDGVKFYKTKQQLLSQGYSESEIVYALYSEPADETGNRPLNPLAAYYAKHPDQANKIATDLLWQQRSDDFEETVADYLGGQAGVDIQSRSYYDLLAADRLGIPYFILILGSFVPLALAIKLNWSPPVAHSVFAAYSLMISLIFLFKLIHEYVRIKKAKH